MVGFREIESKWQKEWADSKIFEANPDKRKKFFGTFPYPYMNGYSHLGHFYTIMGLEAFLRYKRMNGYNVLFPQGWHCTGSPIENAAARVREHEPKQLQIMKDMGFLDKEIAKFGDPKYWVDYFPNEYKKDYQKAGLSIDFRREFITTSLNPCYDKFVQWQFRKLNEKGYVVKGKHPVVWCLKDNAPVGDHARVEGEGETPQEFTLLKFKFGTEYIIAATLRPETIYGQTNLWLDPEGEYYKAKVGSEIWIGSGSFFNKLKEQDKKVELAGNIGGKELLGKFCTAPGIEREIIILPSFFCDPEKGTGIVTSVPSDAPDDYMGLKDLQNDEELCNKYGLDFKKVNSIKVIPIIFTKELGDTPAVKICEEMDIKDQRERDKLESAKKIVYKAGFYAGVMGNNAGNYAGMPVEKAKDAIKKELMKQKKADVFYELTGKVVCRCLTPSIVKIVSDQWFLNYSNPEWKKQVHKCLDNIKLYPEKSRPQFNYVIDWLNDWPCTREFGLGTKLPWDEKWVIESLSDSTIYMAFYTISHKIKEVPIEKINDDFFDYVFLGRGEKPKIKIIDQLKKEFEYWYPMDLRNSGKDLIQNHLAFCLFNHVAIFPEKYWPRGIGTNGWILVDGQKMSKSLGNFLLVRDAIEDYGADSSRFAVLYGGEGLDDANFDRIFAKSLMTKLEQFYEFSISNYNNGRVEELNIDALFEANINKTVRDASIAMESAMFRTALQKIFFDMQGALKSYLKRNPKPNKLLINKFIETQILLLTPFTPFICEEIWHNIGNKTFVSLEKWPKFNPKKINEKFDAIDEMLRKTTADVHSVLKLIKITPSKITIIFSDKWKYSFLKKLKAELKKTRDMKILISSLIDNEHKEDIPKMIQSAIKNPLLLPDLILDQETEFQAIYEIKDSLNKEFGLAIEIEKAENSRHDKARNAMPGKPAIFIS